ncbi:MAG: HAMP domain-containing sensor histidine kinase [Acidimicrobiia bacterium]
MLYRRTRLIAGSVATVGWTLVTVMEPAAWPLIPASVIFTGVTWSNMRFGVPTPDVLVVVDAVVVLGVLLWVRPFPGAEALGLAVVFGSAVVMASRRWLRWLLPSFTLAAAGGAMANSIFRDDATWSAAATASNAAVALLAVMPILFWMAGTIARAFPSESLLAEAVPNPAEFAHMVVEKSREGLAVIDFESRVRFANDAFADMFGWTKEELIGQSLAGVMDDETFRRHNQGVQAALLSRRRIEAFNLELVGRHREGHPVTALVSLSELTGGGDRLVLGAVRDVSEIVALRTKLEESLATKDRFVATVSHELRTPLTAVVAFAEMLRDQAGLADEERSEFVGLIADQSRELSHLIEDLLVFARLDTHDLDVSIRQADLRAEVLAALSPWVVGRSIEVDYDRLDLTVLADPGRLRQIVRNLVANAVKHGGERIGVSAAEVDGQCHLVVHDNGPGVPVGSEDRLFEPFSHRPDTTGQSLSAGLGLNVSLRLAGLMGGTLEYRRVDARTEFVLVLPLAD